MQKAKKQEQKVQKPSFLEAVYKRKFIISLAIAIAISIIAFYIRILRIFKYGYVLDEADPYFMYWGTNYLVEHGIGSWYSLTQANNATHIFWYPWGRDIAHTDYPLSMMLAALTYPIAKLFGLSVMQWAVLQPPIAGALIVLFSYLLVREVGGELAGLFAAFTAAVIPGTLDRTIAGFFVKLGMAQPLVILGFVFFVKMLKENKPKLSLMYSATAGILLGLVAWDWGGYQVVDLILGAFLILYPLVKVPEVNELKLIAIFSAVAILVQIASPTTGFKEIITGAGLFILGGLAYYAIAYIFEKRFSSQLRRAFQWRKIYVGFIVLSVVVGFIMLYFNVLNISGRAYYFVGIMSNNPLVASVSEHQTMSLAMMVNRVGLAFLLTVIFIAYAIFELKKKPLYMFFIVLGALSIYMGFRASYLLMFVATALSVVAGLAVTPIGEGLAKSLGLQQTRKKVVSRDTLGTAVWSTALVFFVIIGLFHGYATVMQAQTPPLILSGGIGLSITNYAWIYTLDIIKNETSLNSVFMPWWDYGYWIPVMTGRATVADGATLNATQIELLARLLTSTNESEALNIALNYLKGPANETYVLAFDVFRAYNAGNNTWYIGPYVSIATGTVGFADIPKSIWMLRIGGRLNLTEYAPYFVVNYLTYQQQQYPVIGPNWTDPLVQKTLIYRMMVDGVYRLNDTSIVAGTVRDINGTINFLDFVSGSFIEDMPFKHLEPFKIVTDYLYNSPTDKLFVAVFIYKIIG